MSQLPSAYTEFKEKYPEIMKSYEELGDLCRSEGPLTEMERELVKLGIAIGAGLEGAVHSHTRRSLIAGASADAIRHVVLLSLTTIGFPAMMRSLSWVKDVLANPSKVS
jgi:alkylhydroperoxidase/carboxymuconolactone decarboxylase family protein YurZ